ncbi:MAG: hypothetical protein QXM82_04500, partial [Ignisphaera sp.]
LVVVLDLQLWSSFTVLLCIQLNVYNYFELINQDRKSISSILLLVQYIVGVLLDVLVACIVMNLTDNRYLLIYDLQNYQEFRENMYSGSRLE